MQNKDVMRHVRLVLLLLALLIALIGYYYYLESPVHVEVVQFNSHLLGKGMPYSVVLPHGYRLITSRGTRYPVLYLLHGWREHYNSWLKQTTLIQYASDYQLIIITPEGGNGWYTDSASITSDQYETYFLYELISDVDSRYRTIQDRRGRAVAGNSMGGYGALKFGLKHPETFTLAASMSGALDANLRNDDSSINEIFGEPNSPTRKANDLQRLAREFPRERAPLLPYFYLDCGTDDPWLESNRDFVNILLERRVVHEYRQLPGGHVWAYWDRQVHEVLRVAAERMVPPEH
ncbi:MAG: esterase family protein [Acidobacteriota bacterium]|nr:esterase family protein [Acidobacteriota bacterium]